MLTLETLPQEDGGGYGVTSPLEPQLVREAKSFEEAFVMARDALQALRESRQRYAKRIAELAAAMATEWNENSTARHASRRGIFGGF